MRRKDEVGNVYGRLTVIEFAYIGKGRAAYWKCQCECGEKIIVRGADLRNGNTTSCGCLNREKNAERLTKHGMSTTKLYSVRKSMISRCYNPNDKEYHNYGGRGITVCNEWRENKQAFFDYTKTLPHYGEKGYSLDRIDNELGYMPNNVRWVSMKEQANNRRTNIIVEYQDREMTLAEASELSGINYCTLKKRWHHGDRDEKLFRPVKKNLSRDCLRN